MKTCRDCDIQKDLDEFYKHRRMKDGHLNICKVCRTTQVIANRLTKVEYYKAYDAVRYQEMRNTDDK